MHFLLTFLIEHFIMLINAIRDWLFVYMVFCCMGMATVPVLHNIIDMKRLGEVRTFVVNAARV